MKKKSAVTAIIILFICVAVYLNLNTAEVLDDGERFEKTFGTNEQSSAGEVIETGEAANYFAEARLEKQKARDSAITTLKESVNEDSLSQETRDRAAASIETISTGAITETRIETLVKAKGFQECVSLINEKGVNVIVSAPEGGLTASDTTKIKDIVVAEAGISPEKIKIIEIK